MKLSNQQLGALGENFAAEWLRKNGYQILDQNWRGTRVELDIVAATKNAIVFVEVKTRSSNTYGFPAEAVTPKKLENIKSAALEWLAKHRVNGQLRIDVISVHFDGTHFEISHIIGVS